MKRKRPRLRAIKGGKPSAPVKKAPAPSTGDDAAVRFDTALGQFLSNYAAEDQKRSDPIDQVSVVGFLLGYAAKFAVPVMGDEPEQFSSAAHDVFQFEVERQKK